MDFLKLVYRALVSSVPSTLLNLVLIPMAFYYGHNHNPNLVLGILLFCYLTYTLSFKIEQQIELEQKRLFGFTPNELFKKVLTGVVDELDKKRPDSSTTHD